RPVLNNLCKRKAAKRQEWQTGRSCDGAPMSIRDPEQTFPERFASMCPDQLDDRSGFGSSVGNAASTVVVRGAAVSAAVRGVACALGRSGSLSQRQPAPLSDAWLGGSGR